MLRRSARRSGQAPPEETPADPSPPAKRGRGGGRGRGRGRGKSVTESGAVEESNQDGASDVHESAEHAAESMDYSSTDAAERNDSSPSTFPTVECDDAPVAHHSVAETDKPEEPSNEHERSESRNEERATGEGSERRLRAGGDGPNWGERSEETGRPLSRDRPQSGEGDRRRRRSRSREEYDAEYDDRRRGPPRGPPPPYRGGHYGGHPNDGYRGGYGPPGPPPPWGYGRGRGRGGPPFRGGGIWRGRGDFGGPHGHHPGMMGPPPGWGDNGYDQMGGPHGPPHMMPPHMRGPPGGPPGPHGPPPPHGHYGPPPGMPPHPPHPHQGQPPPPPQMMGVGPPGMGVPPPHGIPPLPPGPPPPPAPPSNEMENVKTEEEMAAMKEQIARQIEEAREKALEEKKEEQREEKEEAKSEDTEKRKKQASAMFRAARFNKSTVAAAVSSNKAAAAAATTTPVGVPPPPTTPSDSSTPQPVPPPPSLNMSSSLGGGVATRAAAKTQETGDVFGRDDDGGLFGERKATLSLPTAADRAEMQLYNDVLNAPHPSQDSLSPRKAPAPVPAPISTPATAVASKPSSGSADRRDEHSRERRSRSRSPVERDRKESRSPRRTRSPFYSPSSRRERSPKSRSPRRSSPRRERRGRSKSRSRSRSHGRHRSRSRSRSKERGAGRNRHDSGHYRRAGSPPRDQRSSRRRGYDLSPVRNSGGRSGHRGRRGESKSPRRERSRSRSRERKRSPDWSRKTRRGREEEREREERERRRSGGEGRDERRKKDQRKDSARSKENGDGSGDEGKENSTPGHDEMEIDKVIDTDDTVEKRITAPTVVKNTVSIDDEKKCSDAATVSGVAATATATAGHPRPEPYEEIAESIFHAQIKDRNDYGGECICTDGECGVSCVLRYLTVECGRKCPSGDGCQNKAMQKTKGSRVEVFHTGTEKGFGVRALEPIKKGGFIIEYIGEVVTHKAGEKRKKIYAKESPLRRHHYLMTVTDWQNRPFIIDATKYGNSSRFLNHSCEPNAICDKWSVGRRFRMGFFAGRAIAAGEEITFDYRFQNYGRTMIECACGAAKCRKYLASKDNAKEEEERLKAGRDRSEESSAEETDEDDEDEEEEEEVEIQEEDRKKLQKQQSIMDEAERLLKKGILTKKGQFQLLSAVMMRLTPAHQSLRSRLVGLLYASGEKNNEAYCVFLGMNGKTILQKYLTLGVDEETTVSQYRELIPLLEALLELLEGIKKYTETTRETSVMANLVPILRAISAQSEVPDGLVVFEVMHDIVSGVEEEATEEEEEGEWTKRWQQCTSRAAELADTWKMVYSFYSTFKIPKKTEKEIEQKKEKEGVAKPKASTVSMIRGSAFSRSIKTDTPTSAGWQSLEKKNERRDSRDFYSKDRFTTDKSGGGGYRKRKYEDDSASSDRKDYGGYRREEERKKDEREEKTMETPHSATNSTESQEEDAMQISPNLDETEGRERGEPETKRANYGADDYSPRPNVAANDYGQQQHLHQQQLRMQQQRPHHEQMAPGPMPPPASSQWGAAGGGGPSTASNHWGWQHPAAAAAGGQWGMGYGGYPNGLPPAAPIEGISYFRLAPAPGSSLTAELAFWQGAVKYCQAKADEIQHRLDQASQLEQQQNMQHLQHSVAAEVPLVAAVSSPAAAPKEEKPVRLPLNDRLAELTGVPIKKGGGGIGGAEEKAVKTQSPPRAPYRPSDEEIRNAKNVMTKDGRLILISSIAKFCKVRTETGAMYYYNKITRSPTWDLPEGEEANSEDELEVASSSQSASAATASGDSTSASASRSSTTTSGKTPSRGRPQTPPEEPADPISTHEMTEKEKLHRKSEFKTRSGELLKRYVKASMFNDVEDFKRTLRKIIHGCIEKEQKVNATFDFSFSDDVKHRMVEYTKKYVQRHKLKPLSYPDGIAD